jgi:hypothetical protein
MFFFFLWSVNFGYEPELEIKIAQTETYRDAANCKLCSFGSFSLVLMMS